MNIRGDQIAARRIPSSAPSICPCMRMSCRRWPHRKNSSRGSSHLPKSQLVSVLTSRVTLLVVENRRLLHSHSRMLRSHTRVCFTRAARTASRLRRRPTTDPPGEESAGSDQARCDGELGAVGHLVGVVTHAPQISGGVAGSIAKAPVRPPASPPSRRRRPRPPP